MYEVYKREEKRRAWAGASTCLITSLDIVDRTFASVFWMRLRRTRNVFRPGPESWPSGPDQGTSEIHIHRIAMLCFWQHISNIQPPTHRCTYYSALWTSHIRNMFQKSSSPSGQRFQLTVSAYENEGLLS